MLFQFFHCDEPSDSTYFHAKIHGAHSEDKMKKKKHTIWYVVSNSTMFLNCKC